jgi:hypothetical protein
MKIQAIGLLAISLLVAAACGSMQRAMNEVPLEAQAVRIDPKLNFEARTSPFSINFVEQRGDFFAFSVSYSGGCAEHDFDLVSRGDFTSTYPPEVRITLKHDDKGDRCRSMVDEKRYFDMTNLKYEGTTKVLLILTNTNQTFEFNY